MKHVLDRWEKMIACWAASPWASFWALVYGACWIIAEACRGKWIGWDGFATIAAVEIALATFRRFGDGRKET